MSSGTYGMLEIMSTHFLAVFRWQFPHFSERTEVLEGSKDLMIPCIIVLLFGASVKPQFASNSIIPVLAACDPGVRLRAKRTS